ncbi:MAG: hypothetical protein ACRDSR_01075 [Pseudonocardiaceae bacterium]
MWLNLTSRPESARSVARSSIGKAHVGVRQQRRTAGHRCQPGGTVSEFPYAVHFSSVSVELGNNDQIVLNGHFAQLRQRIVNKINYGERLLCY